MQKNCLQKKIAYKFYSFINIFIYVMEYTKYYNITEELKTFVRYQFTIYPQKSGIRAKSAGL